MSRIIQPNGNRHYPTEHGIYIIDNAYTNLGQELTWAIYAPDGMVFYGDEYGDCFHSGGRNILYGLTMKAVRVYVGMATMEE